MMLATGLAVLGAALFLIAAEIRGVRMGAERSTPRERLLIAVVFVIGMSAAVIRLVTTLRL